LEIFLILRHWSVVDLPQFLVFLILNHWSGLDLPHFQPLEVVEIILTLSHWSELGSSWGWVRPRRGLVILLILTGVGCGFLILSHWWVGDLLFWASGEGHLIAVQRMWCTCVWVVASHFGQRWSDLSYCEPREWVVIFLKLSDLPYFEREFLYFKPR
jgi:hypothetical protein